MPSQDRPIEEYALIGDCVTAALINADGGIDWLCLPAFDGPAFFGALLDREKGGEFIIRPCIPYRVERGYVDTSAIFQTRFITESGTAVLTDFFVIARCGGNRGYDFTNLYPTRKLVRIIEVEDGATVPMEMVLSARPHYGREAAAWTKLGEEGYTCGHAALFTNTRTSVRGQDLASEWNSSRGECHFAVLDYGEEQPVPTVKDIRRWQRVSALFWKHWSYFNHYCGAHEKVVRRCAVTLKLLTYAPTGAFVAAPTTSLPETAGGEANWDYRYAWVRDTSFFINTLFRIGYSGEATAFIEFVVKQSMRCRENDRNILPVLYGIRTTSRVEEQELPHLRGYLQSRPVRIGNRAVSQFQLDNFAHILETLYFFKHTGGKIDADKMHLVRLMAELLLKYWREPDSGLWEEAEEAQFTYGKVASWAALMRAATLTDLKDLPIEETCAEIKKEVLARALKGEGDTQHMVSCLDTNDLDAACLLTFLNGFSSETLAKATRKRIESELADGAFLHRNPEHKQRGEGAFFLCMFWRINHLVKEGEQAEAEKQLEEVLGMVSPFGLLSEEIDTKSGAFMGNFPQAFSHLGLIGSILNVDQARRNPQMATLPDHEKFTSSVGPTVGLGGAIAGFIRAPRTLRLFLRSGGSKWRG